MKIKEIRMKYNLSRKELSQITGVPIRTIQSWELEERKAPEYIYKLIESTVKLTLNHTEKPLKKTSNERIQTNIEEIMKKCEDAFYPILQECIQNLSIMEIDSSFERDEM